MSNWLASIYQHWTNKMIISEFTRPAFYFRKVDDHWCLAFFRYRILFGVTSKGPSLPAGSLVEVVAEALRLNEGSYNVVRTYILRTSDARAAIAAIAEELHRRGDRGVAAWLEREAGR